MQSEQLDLSRWGTKFEYPAYWGPEPAHCLILRNGNAIICTEAPDNHSTSVTNRAEVIADLACAEYGIAKSELVWIEHYPPHSDIGETFDLVTFETGPDGKFRRPTWKHLSDEAWRKLFYMGDKRPGEVVGQPFEPEI